ncbi:uncharacterized protein IL334_004766 [Kwoniella shivajii]|uniref:Poly(A) RNA polymerase mitochondrial-like central palm domain-containing protein n=1 Tax=Kwoniella shivajii TaxID=564305 RepID=A0ABZ1D194_9TREE|nr:hypothetical protein IL334_004766 [Kwoniella shivajii]
MSSFRVTSLPRPALLPSPQLISFGQEGVPSLLDSDIDEIDLHPIINNAGRFDATVQAFYPCSNTIAGPIRLSLPVTPELITLVSEGESDEELKRLFRLDSPSPPPSPICSIPPERRKGDYTPPQIFSTLGRRRRSTPILHHPSPTYPSPYKKNKNNSFDTLSTSSYPPSPSPILHTDTPDLTSDSSLSFPNPSITDEFSEYSDQPILFSNPSELIDIFTYKGGEKLPFPVAVIIHKGKGHTKELSKEVIELIDFESSQEHQDQFYAQPNEGFIDLLGLDKDLGEHNNHPAELTSCLGASQEQYNTNDYKFDSGSDKIDEQQVEDLTDICSEPELEEHWFLKMNDSPQMINGNQSTSHTYDQFINDSSRNGLISSLSDLSDIPEFIPKSNFIPAVNSVSPYNSLLSRPSPRKTVPSNLIHPSPPDSFQSDIMQAWCSTEPTEESKKFVMKLLSNLTTVVNSTFGKQILQDGKDRFLVDVFGSVSWGGETGKSGDLDLVILDRAQLKGYEPSLWRQQPGSGPISKDYSGRRSVPLAINTLPRCYHTYTLADCLRRAGMQAVQPIPGASTPIVKFMDPQGKLECDINVNDLGGWYNSSLILHYCQISPYLLRPMIYILKRWLSSQDLNDASGAKGPATMSSYCLTLMIIGYLQIRGCLPNLQQDINVPATSAPGDTSDPDIIWVSWSKEQGVPAHVAFARAPPEGWKSSEPELTVSQAVRGFFAFFSQTSSSLLASIQEKARFDHRADIISILQGGLAKRITLVGGSRIEDENNRISLQSQGFSPAQITHVMEMMRESRIEDEQRMGKGDRGIQPRNWSERRLVVQDPFLWQKNCAGMMSKVGLDRFFASVDRAHKMLQSRGNSATIEELLYNPSPITPRSTPGRGRGRGTPIGRGGGGIGRALWNA